MRPILRTFLTAEPTPKNLDSQHGHALNREMLLTQAMHMEQPILAVLLHSWNSALRLAAPGCDSAKQAP